MVHRTDSGSITDFADTGGALDLWFMANQQGGNQLDGAIDELYFFSRVLSDNEIRRLDGRAKPDNLAGDDLKTGTWTSQIWNSGATENQEIDNIEYGAVIGSGENVWWNVEATDASENTGWFQDPNNDNFIAQSELPNNIQGENFQLSLKLETDNTTHSPSVQDYTLNVSSAGPTPITVSTNSAENVEPTEADLSGTLENLGPNPPVDNAGFFWKESSSSTWNKVVAEQNVSSAPKDFSYPLTSLSENTTYDFKAFGENVTYQDNGAVKTFTTHCHTWPVKTQGDWENNTKSEENHILQNGVLYVSRDNSSAQWTSSQWGSFFDSKQSVDNLTYSFGGNGVLYGWVGVDTDDDGVIDENTGWVKLENTSTSNQLSFDSNGLLLDNGAWTLKQGRTLNQDSVTTREEMVGKGDYSIKWVENDADPSYHCYNYVVDYDGDGRTEILTKENTTEDLLILNGATGEIEERIPRTSYKSGWLGVADVDGTGGWS